MSFQLCMIQNHELYIHYVPSSRKGFNIANVHSILITVIMSGVCASVHVCVYKYNM